MLADEAISAFTDCLENSSKLTSSKSFIDHNGGQSQAVSASSNTLDVKCRLNLGNNQLQFSGALAVMGLLSSKACLINSLNLTNTEITTVTKSDSLVDMFELTTNNSCLTELYVDHNNFTGEGVHLLTKIMNVCESLEYLFCNDCKLTSEDIQQVLSLLKSTHTTSSCSKLKEWDLWGNNIDDVGVTALIECIPDLFPSLEYVRLNCNPVSDEMKHRLKNYWKVNQERREAEEKAEIETRRAVMLSEWMTIQSLPQDQQLLEEFMEMWDELLQTMCDWVDHQLL